jgi:hypothetical protein
MNDVRMMISLITFAEGQKNALKLTPKKEFQYFKWLKMDESCCGLSNTPGRRVVEQTGDALQVYDAS